MYVLPVRKVLAMDTVPRHEACLDDLVEWSSGMAPCIFVSQTWLSLDHPDPQGVKLELLKDILARALQGKLHVEPFHYAGKSFGPGIRVDARELRKCRYVWFDLFSVPQENVSNMRKAVASIVSYVADSAHFLCLAGPWRHLEHDRVCDVRAWMGRGWCRLEWLANALSPNVKPVIVAQSPSSIESHGPMPFGRSWLTETVGLADFTKDYDRQLLGPVINELIGAREQQTLADGDMPRFRMIHALRRKLLEGTGFELTLEESLDAWLRAMRFEAIDEVCVVADHDGLSPLFYAVVDGRVDLVAALLQRGAQPNTVVQRANAEFGVPASSTPLSMACFLHDSPRLVRLLLESGAVEGTGDCNVMHIAFMHGRCHTVDVLCEWKPELLTKADELGFRPLGCAAYNGQAGMIKHMLAAYPERAQLQLQVTDGWGAGLCSCALERLGDLHTLSTVLDAGAKPDEVGPVTSELFKMLFNTSDKSVAAFRRWRWWRRPLPWQDHFAHASRCTALHRAAHYGNLLAIDILLEHLADPASMAHPMKMTPLHLATRSGHRAAALRLVEAGSSIRAVDRLNRTPVTLAIKARHLELAAELRRREGSGARTSQGLFDACAAVVRRCRQHVRVMRRYPPSERQNLNTYGRATMQELEVSKKL